MRHKHSRLNTRLHSLYGLPCNRDFLLSINSAGTEVPSTASPSLLTARFWSPEVFHFSYGSGPVYRYNHQFRRLLRAPCLVTLIGPTLSAAFLRPEGRGNFSNMAGKSNLHTGNDVRGRVSRWQNLTLQEIQRRPCQSIQHCIGLDAYSCIFRRSPSVRLMSCMRMTLR